MKALIIYDSVYGNTEQIARAIANGFIPYKDIVLLRVCEVKPELLKELNILIAGSPTQRFRLTSPMNDMLGSIPLNGLKGVKAAAFDTRLSLSHIESSIERFAVKNGGYAAKGIANKLKKSGGELVMPPEGFFVKGMEGPLLEGELERAADWAKQILGILEKRDES